MIREPIYISDNAEFIQKEIKQTAERLNRSQATGMDGITSDIYLRTFKKLPRILKANNTNVL